MTLKTCIDGSDCENNVERVRAMTAADWILYVGLPLCVIVPVAYGIISGLLAR